VQVSGLSSENTRLGHLEQNMKEVRNDVQSALQQLDSRQQIADKQFLDLYHLLSLDLAGSAEAGAGYGS